MPSCVASSATIPRSGSCHQYAAAPRSRLIAFRLGAAMFMGDLIFFKEFGHFLSNRIVVMRNRHDVKFLPGFHGVSCVRGRPWGSGRGDGIVHGWPMGLVSLIDFQKRLFGKRTPTMETGHEIAGLPHGHGDAKVERDPALMAMGTHNVFESIGNVRLGLEIKLHIRIDRKVIMAVQTQCFPVPVVSDGSAVNGKPTLFANGALRETELILNVSHIRLWHGACFLSGNGNRHHGTPTVSTAV